MKIGENIYKHGVFLAPMAGIGDYAFRAICKKMGAEGLCSELLSAKATVYQNQKTDKLAEIKEEERPAALQIFGNDPLIMARAAEMLLKYNPAYIDINMGCPVPKLVKNNEGSALMKTPALCGQIVSEVKKAANVPVTVKIRRGIDEDNQNACEVAKVCEQNGADAVFIHGRTTKQMYSGKADWEIIRKIKENVKIPVIGNGDIIDAASAKKMFEETGCDGIMIGRGAFGSPWIFEEIISAMEGKLYTPPDDARKKEIILEHLEKLEQDKGKRGAAEVRKHLSKYIKGLPDSAAARNKINSAETYGEMIDIINGIFYI